LWLRVWGLGLGVWGSGFGVQGSGFRGEGVGVKPLQHPACLRSLELERDLHMQITTRVLTYARVDDKFVFGIQSLGCRAWVSG